jgi:hypothetical protein
MDSEEWDSVEQPSKKLESDERFDEDYDDEKEEDDDDNDDDDDDDEYVEGQSNDELDSSQWVDKREKGILIF